MRETKYRQLQKGHYGGQGLIKIFAKDYFGIVILVGIALVVMLVLVVGQYSAEVRSQAREIEVPIGTVELKGSEPVSLPAIEDVGQEAGKHLKGFGEYVLKLGGF